MFEWLPMGQVLNGVERVGSLAEPMLLWCSVLSRGYDVVSQWHVLITAPEQCTIVVPWKVRLFRVLTRQR